jgi:hypothetical protein
VKHLVPVALVLSTPDGLPTAVFTLKMNVSIKGSTAERSATRTPSVDNFQRGGNRIDWHFICALENLRPDQLANPKLSLKTPNLGLLLARRMHSERYDWNPLVAANVIRDAAVVINQNESVTAGGIGQAPYEDRPTRAVALRNLELCVINPRIVDRDSAAGNFDDALLLGGERATGLYACAGGLGAPYEYCREENEK